MTNKKFAAGYVIRFSDGGESEEQVLWVGSLEECERLGDLLPGVAYKGNRPVQDIEFVIASLPETQEGEGADV